MPDSIQQVEVPCPICVHLNRWYGDSPIKSATHGAGGPDLEWHACYEHYRVITAFEWLCLTRHFVKPKAERN